MYGSGSQNRGMTACVATCALVAMARGDPLHLATGTSSFSVPTISGEKIDTELRITALRMLCDRYSGVAHRAIVTATW